MARALWSGSLSFGLVNVPVQLFSAVRDQDLHFRQLHEKDGSPIETRRFCSAEDEEVPFEEVGHGYELDSGKEVVLSDEELSAAAPRKTRTIDIEAKSKGKVASLPKRSEADDPDDLLAALEASVSGKRG